MTPTRKIRTGIWRDNRFRTLSVEAKLLYFYYVASAHSNRLGFYVLPRWYMVADLRLSPERVEKAFQEVLNSGLISYDEESSVIFVRDYIFWDPPENPKQVKAAIKVLESVPAPPELFAELKRSLERLNRRMCQPLIQWLEEKVSSSAQQEVAKNEQV